MLSGSTEALLPPGSLVYTETFDETISVVSETDSFTLDLDPGQTITLLVEPAAELQPIVALFDPFGTFLGSASSAAAGQHAVLQSVAIVGAGTYTVTVGGVAGTLGDYSVQVILNAAIEAEPHGGPANDSQATAQDLDSSFLSLGFGTSERGAVLGLGDGDDSGTMSQTQSDNVYSPNVLTFDFSGAPAPLGAGVLTVSAIADLNSSSEFLTLDAEGISSQDLFITDGLDENQVSTTTVALSQAQLAAQLADDGTITFTVTPSSSVDNLRSNELTLELSYPTAAPTTDFYSFSLAAGQSASLALTSLGSDTATLELLDSAGNLITSGIGAANVDQVINNFVSVAGGIYYANVSGGNSEYSLVVTRNADFDSEPNDAPPPDAQDISLSGTVLGALAGSDRITNETEPNDDGVPGGSITDLPFANDWSGSFLPIGGDDYQAVLQGTISAGNDVDWDFFKILASPGDFLVLDLLGAPSGAGTLGDPYLWLYDNTGTLIAANDDFFSLESHIEFSNFLYAGDYYVVADSFGGDTGTYELIGTLTTSNLGGSDNDFYTFEANAGDSLSIEATIPAAGPGEFDNNLDISVELFDPNGELVASAGNQTSVNLAHSASLSGAYSLHLFSQNATSGEYVLAVSGQSGSPLPFEVVASVPESGEFLAEQSSQMAIDLSSSVLATSVEAADLTVDGAPAGGVTIIDGDTLVFDLPVLAEGIHNATISAGALTSLQNAPLEAFLSQFTLDFTAPRVIDSSIQDGNTVSAGALIYTVQFDEPLLNSNLGAGVVTLDNELGSQFSPTVFDYDSNSSTLTLEYTDLPEGLYTLTLSSGDGLLEDIAGNNLDGEIVTSPIGPNVSGDGFEGGDFTLEFVADHFGAVPFPVPLEPIQPLGALVYESGVSERINTSQDIDQYSIAIDADQAVTVVVEGSDGLTPTVILENPNSPTMATATAAGPDQAAVLQTLPAVTSGTYLITIHGDDAAPGGYTLQVLLNSAVEEESFDGPDNGSLATSQEVDLGFVDLGSLGGSVTAIQGRGDGDVGPLIQTQSDNVYYPNVLTFDFPDAPVPLGDGVLTVSAIADLDSSSEYLTLDAEGIFGQDLFVTDGLENGLVSTTVALSQAQLAAQLADDGVITFTVTPSASVNSLGPSALTLELSYPSALLAADFYRFSLAAGQSASLALTTFRSDTAILELLDGGGNLISIGTGASNVDQVINNFVSVAGGTYYATVDAGSAEYSLVVTRGADLDSEPNNDIANSQDLSEILGAMGHLVGTNDAGDLPAFSDPIFQGQAAEPLPEVNLPYQPSINSPFRAAKELSASPKLVGSEGVYSADDAGSLLGHAATAFPSTIVGPIPILQTFGGPVIDFAVPPDPIAAAGPEQVVALVNTQIGIYDKTTGDELFLQSLNGPDGFFGSVGAQSTIFDPWILFDTETDRFFAIGIDIFSAVESNVFLAVSTDATPTSGEDWHKYKLDFTHNADGALGSEAHFPDYPKMGVGDDAIWITGNYFPIASGTGVYAGITAIEKDPLLDGGPANIVYEEYFNGFSVMPMTQYDSPNTQYFVEASTGSGSSITIHAITDVLTSPTRSTLSVGVPSFDRPVDVPQLGGDATADSIDARVMTGVWRDGSMWFAHAITDPAVGDGESLVRWYEVSTAGFPNGGTPTLVQSGNVDPGPGEHAWIPAVAVDGNGNLGIGFALGGTNQYLGAGFTGRLANDPLGSTVLPVTQYATGLDHYDTSGGIGRNRWGDYSGISIDPADDATFWVFNEYAAVNSTWATQIASFQLQEPEDEDWYQFAVNAGDILRIETFTPGGGPLELVNELDPSIELIDPLGNVIPYANRVGNELIFHVAQSTGQYRLRLFAEASEGEYFVQIEGATGSSLPPVVIDTNPDADTLVPQFPLTYTLSWSEPLWTQSMEASDFRIGGLPAMSVTPIDGATFEFQVDPAANVGDGVYVVEFLPSAVFDLQGQVNDSFVTTFELDTTGPVILATLWNGQPMLASGIYQEGPLTFTAMFSEDLFLAGSARHGPFTPGTDDVVLVDRFSGTTYAPLSVDYDPDTDLLEASFEPLPEGDYELTLISGDGGLEDRIGNHLDGEPLGPGFDGTITGDGVPGGNYTVSFDVDRISTELHPWAAWEPLGSLMFANQDNLGMVNVAGDQDVFQFFLEGGQTLAAVLTPLNPTAFLSLELLGLTTTLTASGAGEAVVLPLMEIPAAALFELRVSGDTKSGYDLDLYRNAVVETTVIDTDDGNPLAADSSFLALGSGRYGVMGLSEAVPGSAPPITSETEPNDDGVPGGSIADLPWANDWSGSFLPIGGDDYQAVLEGAISAGNDVDWDFFKILASPGDTLVLDLRGAPSGAGTLGDPYLWLFDNTGALIDVNDDFFTLESHIEFNSFLYAGDYYVVADSFGGNTGTYELTGTLTTSNLLQIGPAEPDTDFYTLDLSGKAGHRLDVVLSGYDGTDFTASRLELLDDAGNVLANAVEDPLGVPSVNVDLAIVDFVVPDVGSNVYTLRFETERPGEYGIVVTDSLVFDMEPNNFTSAPLRNLDEAPAALGWLSEVVGAQLFGSDRDGNLFAIDLQTGAGTLVGTLGHLSTEIEFDPQSGRAFSQFPNGEFTGQEFDLETATAIGPPIYNAGAYTGLEWIGDDLYGTMILEGGGQAPSELRILEPFVGTSTLIGPTGQGPISGLAYDAASDTLYGIAGGAGASDLYTIDRNTGVATVVGSTGFRAGSLEFGPDGQLYGGGSGEDAGNLYRVDPATGNGVLVGPTGFGTLTGLLLAPIPAGVYVSPTGEPISVDTYEITLLQGQTFTARTDVLLDDLLTQPANVLDPALAIFDSQGQVIAFDSDSRDGKNAEVTLTASVGGTYWIQVQAESGSGTYLLNTSKGAMPGDFDGNRRVDGDDFLAWQAGFGMPTGAEIQDGDADGDGDVDGDDFLIWQSNFGSGGGGTAAGAQPELRLGAVDDALSRYRAPVTRVELRRQVNEGREELLALVAVTGDDATSVRQRDAESPRRSGVADRLGQRTERDLAIEGLFDKTLAKLPRPLRT